MPSNPDFPPEYLAFHEPSDNLNEDARLKKSLTFIGASAVSLLSYEQEVNVAHILRTDDRFELVRTNEIVSEVWFLANVAGPLTLDTDGSSTALLAWSTRLNTVFVGIPGTRSWSDVASDIDIRQMTSTQLGSKFHAGFLQRAGAYIKLIKQLARKYNVVVCGHSFGGALGTIATYQVLAENLVLRSATNAWDSGNCGLSVVTFGSPSMMVLDDRESTGTLQDTLAIHFHHVINIHDIIPFTLNHCLQNCTNGVEKWWTIAASTFEHAFPELKIVKEALGLFFKRWAEMRGKFAHFGYVHLLKRDGQETTCRQITAMRQIPSTPLIDRYNIRQFHSMEHYAYCLGLALHPKSQSYGINPAMSMTSEQFSQDCIPLPDTILDCEAMIQDNRISVQITIRTGFAQFLLRKITFKQRDTEIQLKGLVLTPQPESPDQVVLEAWHDIDPKEGPYKTLQAATAIERDLQIHDSFGRSACISVREIQWKSLQQISLPTAFESVRLAVIMAFTDHIAKVQSLKLDLMRPNAERLKLAGSLDARLESIVKLVDNIVATACPHLVVAQLQPALETLNELWPQFWGPQQTLSAHITETDPSRMDDVTECTANERLRNRIPTDCPGRLKTLLTQTLDSFERKITGSNLSVNDWEKSRYCKLIDLFPNVPSLTRTLETLGRDLYDRSDDPEERIEQAIQQLDRALSVLHYCHFIIITQLNAPPQWYWTTKKIVCDEMWWAFPPSSIAGIIGGLSLAAAEEGVGTMIAAAIFGGVWFTGAAFFIFTMGTAAAVAVYNSMNDHVQTSKRFLQLNFEGSLRTTLQVLGIPSSASLPVMEKPIIELLGSDLRSQESLEALQKWQQKLKEGIQNLSRGKRDAHIEPSIFWSKWLFDVARVGQLRDTTGISSQIRVGVEGPTAVGKSELLTVLTGASEEVFRSGSDASCRTMEIQSYQPPGLNTIFTDCPGIDDKDQRVREMARIFREIFSVVIFVIPWENQRAKANEECLCEVAKYLRERKDDLRPIRILLSKADRHDINRRKVEVFRNAIFESKRAVIDELKRLGSLSDDFMVTSRRAYKNKIVLANETLEDIVRPYSTHAQMSLGEKALSDCPAGEERHIEGLHLFQTLYQMAEEDKLWDVESLRQWIRSLVPNSAPGTGGRVFQTDK